MHLRIARLALAQLWGQPTNRSGPARPHLTYLRRRLACVLNLWNTALSAISAVSRSCVADAVGIAFGGNWGPTPREVFSMRSALRVVALLAASLLAFQSLAIGQSATTSLRGTVYDPKGAVVAGAAVTLTNPSTGFSRSAKTDGQGNYQFLELPPATYNLSAKATGFANVEETHIELLVSTPSTVNVTMQVSGGTVTVEVAGAAPDGKHGECVARSRF